MEGLRDPHPAPPAGPGGPAPAAPGGGRPARPAAPDRHASPPPHSARSSHAAPDHHAAPRAEPRPSAPTAHLIGAALLLALYPVAWTAPLLRTGLLSFLPGEEVSILSSLQVLWDTDVALALVVGALGVAAPFLKSLALVALAAGRMPARALPALEIAGKLSMGDVFLLALGVVLVKGVGIGHLETAWGLHLFIFLTLGSILLTHLIRRRLRTRS